MKFRMFNTRFMAELFCYFDTNILLLPNITSFYLFYFVKIFATMEKTPEKILKHLKMKGPQTVSAMAKNFDMTNEGMRLHVLKLEESGLVTSESQTKGVGRPILLYRVSEEGNKRFSDNHAPLAVQLMESVQELLGTEFLDLMLETKRKNDFERYQKALAEALDEEEKLSIFTEMRSSEGYMAELERDKDGWVFIENHCPICTAASYCDGFCKLEIENIRTLLGEKLNVEREDHVVRGDRRCTYRIKFQGR